MMWQNGRADTASLPICSSGPSAWQNGPGARSPPLPELLSSLTDTPAGNERPVAMSQSSIQTPIPSHPIVPTSGQARRESGRSPAHRIVPGQDGPMSPRVTVVIAAYNAESYLRETIESVLAQRLQDIEVIVVDDGSTDGTLEILRAFSDHRLTVLRQRNSGVSAARNAGLAAARAPYIFFLDADDMLVPDALYRMVSTLDARPQRVACFGHHLRIAEDGSELSTRADLRWK